MVALSLVNNQSRLKFCNILLSSSTSRPLWCQIWNLKCLFTNTSPPNSIYSSLKHFSSYLSVQILRLVLLSNKRLPLTWNICVSKITVKPSTPNCLSLLNIYLVHVRSYTYSICCYISRGILQNWHLDKKLIFFSKFRTILTYCYVMQHKFENPPQNHRRRNLLEDFKKDKMLHQLQRN